MNFNKLHFLLINLLIVSSLCISSCQTELKIPFPFIPKKFEEVDAELAEHLRIPFFENGKYGLADYEGNIKVTPQFSEIRMINLAYPFYWAGEKDAMTLHDLKGDEVLGDNKKPIKENDFTRFERLEFYEEDIPSYELLLRILANEEEAKKNPKQARYYYLNEKTKRPLRSYFEATYDHIKKYDSHKLENFQSDNGIDSNVKVKMENGAFTFLDKNGNQLVEPNFNSYLLTDDKIILYRKDGKAALKDLKNGWQTDFIFERIRTTPCPHIFTAEISNVKDKTTSKFIIGKKGKITQLDVMGGEIWKVLNEKYTFCQKRDVNDKYTTHYWLMNNNTFTKEKDLLTGRIYELFDTYGFDFSTDRNEKRFVTLEGDTLLKPISKHAFNLNNSVYKTSDGTNLGIADKNGNVLLEIEASQLSYHSDKIIALRKDKKYGWANVEGKMIFPIEYDRMQILEKVGKVIMMKDKKFGLYDLDGKEILPLIYKAISPEPITQGNGLGFRIQVNRGLYVVSPDLEIIMETNNDNRIINKSDFNLMIDSEEMKKDFEWANPVFFHTNYSLFVGKTHTHIFRSDKKYVASVEGRSGIHEKPIYVGKISSLEDGLRLSGLVEVDRKGRKVWMRLRDGFVFEK